MVVRHATTEGTASYKARFIDQLHPSHFSIHNNLWFSSIGMGAYFSDPDADTSAQLRDMLAYTLQAGCNHVDTSISHRSQASEHIVGQALASAFARRHLKRDEIVVAARGGLILFGKNYPTDAAAHVRKNLIDTEVAAEDEFAQGWHHCIAPRYLRSRFRQSLTNLGLGSLDIYYLHNPEVQRVERGPQIFENRLLSAFAELEEQIRTGRLVYYGLATQDGFRVPPDNPAYLSLARLIELAQNAGGPDHHFRYVQAPLNLAMREIFEFKNQVVNGREMTLLEAAQELDIVVTGSSALWQGQLTMHMPGNVREAFPEMETNAQAAIQFARSAPGLASALVSMRKPEHVRENMAVAIWPLASAAKLTALLA